MTLGDVQRENKPWREYNFPKSPNHQPLLGVIEEIGELSEALIAVPLDMAKVKDAFGDIGVYACDLCTRLHLDIQKMWDSRVLTPTLGQAEVTICLGRICHAFLKAEQKIRVGEAHFEVIETEMTRFLAMMESIAHNWDVNFESAVIETWLTVKTRDWQKDKKKGITGQ